MANFKLHKMVLSGSLPLLHSLEPTKQADKLCRCKGNRPKSAKVWYEKNGYLFDTEFQHYCRVI